MLRLTRRTFVEGEIRASSWTGIRETRQYRDYDLFRMAACRAFANPLLESVRSTVLYGDCSRRDPSMDPMEAWLTNYDDGSGTDWEERVYVAGTRDRTTTERSSRFDPYPLGAIMRAHVDAGCPKEWLWASFDVKGNMVE